MSQTWEDIHQRGVDTCAVWNEFNPDFMVGQLTYTAHLADVDSIPALVQSRDDAEDYYDEGIDAKDAHLELLAKLNVRAVGVLRGNLEDGDLLHRELDDVSGMPNKGSGKILARGRKLLTVWKKVNTARAALASPLPPVSVGGTVAAGLEAAIPAYEPKVTWVAQKLSAWSSAKSALELVVTRVDRGNKRWYEAWGNDYAAGTAEHDALSQIDTGPGAVALPGEVTFTVMWDASSGKFHLDATGPHTSHFRLLRKGPGESEYITRKENEPSPILDTATLAGEYTFELQGMNSSGDGPVSAPQTATKP